MHLNLISISINVKSISNWLHFNWLNSIKHIILSRETRPDSFTKCINFQIQNLVLFFLSPAKSSLCIFKNLALLLLELAIRPIRIPWLFAWPRQEPDCVTDSHVLIDVMHSNQCHWCYWSIWQAMTTLVSKAKVCRFYLFIWKPIDSS